MGRRTRQGDRRIDRGETRRRRRQRIRSIDRSADPSRPRITGDVIELKQLDNLPFTIVALRGFAAQQVCARKRGRNEKTVIKCSVVRSSDGDRKSKRLNSR